MKLGTREPIEEFKYSSCMVDIGLSFCKWYGQERYRESIQGKEPSEVCIQI